MVVIETNTVILSKELEPTLVERFENSDDYTKVCEQDDTVYFQKAVAVPYIFSDSFYKGV